MAGSEKNDINTLMSVHRVVRSLDADSCFELSTCNKSLFEIIASDQKASGDALKPHSVNGSCHQNGIMGGDYNFHTISAGDFEKLAITVVSEVYKIPYKSFGPCRDGGRDALAWSANLDLGGGNVVTDKDVVVQVKHTTDGSAKLDNGLREKVFGKEKGKVEKLVRDKKLDVYVIITNYGLSAGQEDKLVDMFKGVGALEAIVIGKEMLSQLIDERPKLKQTVLDLFGVYCGDPAQLSNIAPGQQDSFDCLLAKVQERDGDNLEEQFACRLSEVIVHFEMDDLLRAREAFKGLCDWVTAKEYFCIPMKEHCDNLTAFISKKCLQRFTKVSFSDGFILLSFNNSDVACNVNVLNFLGILAVELSMPQQANELFCVQLKYFQNRNAENISNPLEEITILNNCGISYTLTGRFKETVDLLGKAGQIGDSLRKSNCVCGPHVTSVFAALYNNLGRVYLDAGQSHQAEDHLHKASNLLKEANCMTIQEQIWSIVVERNFVQLLSAQKLLVMMKEKLGEVYLSLRTLDFECKPQVSKLVLAELVKVDLEMKQNEEANKKFDIILLVLARYSLWTEHMAADELDVLLLMKVAEIFQWKGQILRANGVLKKALKMCGVVYGTEHPTTAEVLYRCGKVCYLLEEYVECAALLSEATKIYELRYLDNCPRLMSCYCKLAQIERFHLEEIRNAGENIERAMGILSVVHQQGEQLQLHYLKQLVTVGIIETCISFQLVGNSVSISLSYDRRFQTASKGCASSQSSRNFKVPLKFHTNNSTDLLLLFTKMSVNLAQLGRTRKSIKITKGVLHFCQREGSRISQALLYSCLGFVQALSQNKKDGTCAEKNLQTAGKKLQNQPESYDSDNRKMFLLSLSLMVHAFRALRCKEKETVDVYGNMSVVLSLGEDEEFSDVFSDHLIYTSAHKLPFQDELVKVDVVVNKVFGMSMSSTSRYPSTYQPTVQVHRCAEPKVLVLATCQHRMDVEVLRLFSKSVSESVRQSLNFRETLDEGFIIDVKSVVSLKSHKALCDELELVIPLYVTENSKNTVTRVGCSISPKKHDAVVGQLQLCSGFSRYSASCPYSSEVVISKFIVSCVKRSDQLGVLCDLSLRNGVLSVFLMEPNASIQLRCLGNLVELQTKILTYSECSDLTSASKHCGCSGMYRIVTDILVESSRSVGVELDLQVDNRQCCNQNEKQVDRQLRCLVECENQEPLWKEEASQEKCMSDVKEEVQLLQHCLKRSRVNVAVLQGVITELLSRKDVNHTRSSTNSTTCSTVVDERSSDISQLRGGASLQGLPLADSGIDSSDSEKKGATVEAGSGESAANVGEQENYIPCNTSEVYNPNLSARGLNSDDQLESCGEPSNVSVAPKSVVEIAEGKSSEEAESSSPLSSSSEDEDTSSGESTSTVRKKSPRHFRCWETKKRPIKQWHKTEKLREVTSLQRTIERLERTVQLMKGEMKEMEKNYGEALVQCDSALRMLERMKFRCELEKKNRRRGEHANGGEKQEDKGNGSGPGGDGIGNESDPKDQEDRHSRCTGVSSGGETCEGITGGQETQHFETKSHGVSDRDKQHGTIDCSEDKQRPTSTSSYQEDIDESDGQSTTHSGITSYVSAIGQVSGTTGYSEDQQCRSMKTSSKQEDFDETDDHPTTHSRITSRVSAQCQVNGTIGHKEDHQDRSMKTSGKQEDFDETDGHPIALTTKISHRTKSCTESEKTASRTTGNLLGPNAYKSENGSLTRSRVSKQTIDLPVNGSSVVLSGCKQRSMEESFKEVCNEHASDEVAKMSSCQFVSPLQQAGQYLGNETPNVSARQLPRAVKSPDSEIDSVCEADRGQEDILDGEFNEDPEMLKRSWCEREEVKVSVIDSNSAVKGAVVKNNADLGNGSSSLGSKGFQTHYQNSGENTEMKQIVISSGRPNSFSGDTLRYELAEHAVSERYCVEGSVEERNGLTTPEIEAHSQNTCQDKKKRAILSCYEPELMPRQLTQSDNVDDDVVPDGAPAVTFNSATKQIDIEAKSARSVTKVPPAFFSGVDSNTAYLGQGARPKQTQALSTHVTPDSPPDVQSHQTFLNQGARSKQTRILSTDVIPDSPPDVQSHQTFLEQGARPKQLQTLSTNVIPDSTPGVQSHQTFLDQGAKQKQTQNLSTQIQGHRTFLEQGARPKQYQQSVAGRKAKEPNGSNDSLLASSPDNHGLNAAFLARHSQDCSVSLHSYQASDDFYLSTPPLEWNQNGNVSMSSIPRRYQQYVGSNSQLTPSDCKAQITPEIPRYLWELPNTGSLSAFAAHNGQMAETSNQSTSLFDQQSTIPFQSGVHRSETPTSSSAFLPFVGDVSSRHDREGRQSQTDPLHTRSVSDNLHVSSSVTVDSTLVQPQGAPPIIPSNTGGDKSNGEKKGTFSCEETDKTAEDPPLEDEVEIGELENLSVSSTESFQSVEETLNTLESRVAEACAMVERVFRERRAREQEAREREERAREERELLFREQEEREREEEERAARAGQDGHTTAGNDNQEPGIDGERYPVQESPQWLCEHYQRRCKVRFPCCRGYHPCHRCHNSSDRCSNEEAKAHEATHLQCIVCREEQPVTDSYETQTCQSCGTKLSDYFCPKCKHFTGVEKKPYHCDKCGICRIHKDRSFHCEVCNVCLDKRLQGKHKCRPDSGHDECCICLEDAFSGCQILPCSHKVHRDCAIAMIRNGIRTCPVCRHPLYSADDESQ